MHAIASGRSGLPAHKVHAYRELFTQQGYALPELDLNKLPQVNYVAPVEPILPQRPTCKHRSQEALHQEPCLCGSASKVPVYSCEIHKRCLQNPVKLLDLIPSGICSTCEDYATRNWSLGDVTACITVFKRYDALERLVASIKKFYPELKILVQDTEGNASWGRNRLLEQCETELFLLLEEDFVFTERTDLEQFITVLNHNPEISLVCGSECEPMGVSPVDRSRLLNTSSELRVEGELGVCYPSTHPWRFSEGVRFQLCDSGHNFFIAEKSKLPQWDEAIPMGGEHEEWFLRMKNCAFAPEVVVNHFRDHTQFQELRDRDFRHVIQEKHGFRFVWSPEYRW